MKTNRIIYFLAVILISSLWACSGSQTEGELIDDNLEVDKSISENDKEYQKKFFQLPSPVELFMFMWEDKAPFNTQLLSSISNADKYVGNKKKAKNLGVFSADIAYCSVYDKNKETIKLFSATKKLAEDLGLTEGFDPVILDRIDKNIDNSDSLYQITSDSYSKSLVFLQSQNQTQILPYILYGGWLESLYISTQTIKKYNPESEIAIRITDQGLLLENLIEFFQYLEKNDSEVSSEISELQSLQVLYDKALDAEDGLISKALFSEIKTKVKELRTNLTK